MAIKPVSKVAVGDRMRASHHNEVVDAVRSITPHPVITEPFAEVFMGVIESQGPSAEADYADERYWVREQYISDVAGDHTDGFTLADVDIPTDGFGRWITAENLAEKLGATHDLDAGTFVHVFLAWDSQAPGVVRYFFDQAITPAPEWERLSNNPGKVDNGGTLAGGATGAGDSAYISYTNGVLDGEQWIFEAFEEDGGGDSVAVTLADDVWFRIEARFDTRNGTASAQMLGTIELDKVTTQFNAGALNFAALPTRVNLGSCAIIESFADCAGHTAFAEGHGSGRVLMFGPVTGLTNVHGIAYRYASLSNPLNPGFSDGHFGDWNAGAAVKWKFPDSWFMQGVV